MKSLGLVIRDLINNIHKSRQILSVDDETRIEIVGSMFLWVRAELMTWTAKLSIMLMMLFLQFVGFLYFARACLLAFEARGWGRFKTSALVFVSVGLIDFSCSAQDSL